MAAKKRLLFVEIVFFNQQRTHVEINIKSLIITLSDEAWIKVDTLFLNVEHQHTIRDDLRG